MFYICERFSLKVEIKYRLNLLLEKWERVGESHKIVGQQNNIRQQYHTKLSESFQDDSFSLWVGCGFRYHKKHTLIYLLYFQAFWNLILYVGIKHWGLGPLHLVIVYRKLAIYVELVQAKVWQMTEPRIHWWFWTKQLQKCFHCKKLSKNIFLFHFGFWGAQPSSM